MKSKILKSLAKQFEVHDIGATFWAADLYYLTNKNDPDSKRLYVLVTDHGSKTELVNIYDGTATTITQYTNYTKSIFGSNNYQRDCVLDLIFASFVTGITINNNGGSSFHYYKANLLPDKDTSCFKLGDFEMYMSPDGVELYLPNVDCKITGRYKKLPMEKSPEIFWDITNTKKPAIVSDKNNNGYLRDIDFD